MKDFLINTVQVWRASRQEDKKREKISRTGDELEFLPAAVEVLETPASPVGRAMTWFIVLLFTTALLWSYFGWIDTEAVANGKIVPGGQVKTIQPLEIGSVRAIHVRDGQKVSKGDLLIELDPTESDANEERLQQDLLAVQLEISRLKALLELAEDLTAVPLDGTLSFEVPDGISEDLFLVKKTLLLQTLGEFKAQKASLRSQIAQRKAAAGMIDADIRKYEEIIPLLSERVEAREKLLKTKAVSRTAYLELKQQLVENKGDLSIERQRKKEVLAQISSLQEQLIESEASFFVEQQTLLAESLQQEAALLQELRKASERNRLRNLRAPVDGIVQQLQVHTVGGVVQPAQAIMTIVPENVPLQIDAMVENKDVGFVEKGQRAEIKVESFPYTKYGMIEGEVESISADAIEDENLGRVYQVKASMNSDQILVDNRWVKLTPGMSVTLEVKTGKRRLIEFFLAPLLRYQDEALKER
ncbi:HlyD family type I secretion periplasmic adaptor subunit [Kiloniella sp. b19]|uniref:HlyD family type I secretion periplasmic adaptor subunit n=1 Tax=Kiloniella sp. GXU_MW_B19 TaxID=3141326 RepID=UPI0031D13107